MKQKDVCKINDDGDGDDNGDDDDGDDDEEFDDDDAQGMIVFKTTLNNLFNSCCVLVLVGVLV